MSRSVRPSSRSRRGRHGSGRSPCSASLDTTRRVPAWEESGDAGSPEDEASGTGTSDGNSHHSPGHSVPREEPQRLLEPKREEPLSDTGAHWRLHSARSFEHHRLVSPNSMNIRKQGSCPERDTRAGSPTAVAVLERARRDHQFTRETTEAATPYFRSAPSGGGGAGGTGGGCGDDES